MKQDNRGFTFVELLVGIVIFGLVTTAALGFVVTASKTYGNVNGAINQNLDAQLAVNQIAEYLIDCNGSLSFSETGSSLRITNKGENGDEVYVFSLADDQLLLQTGNAQNNASLLANGVTVFDVELSPSRAVISLNTEKRGRVLEESRTVALRNQPEIVYGT